jgi:hypothetical protein
VRSGTLDLDRVTVRTVGLDDPAAGLELAARSNGLDFVALVAWSCQPAGRPSPEHRGCGGLWTSDKCQPASKVR